jgi:heme-degrading monooxygenase HmoA
MHVRITTITGATDIDAGIALARDQSVPALQKLRGYRGLTASADRSSGTVAVLTLWETEDDLNASEADVETLRADAVRVFGGEPTVERFEQVLAEMPGGPPPVGSTLLVRPFKVDPARLEETLDMFKSVVLPEIKAQPGFLAARQLVDRSTGEGAVGLVWADNESAKAGAAAGEQRRAEAASRGVEFGEPMLREVVFQAL